MWRLHVRCIESEVYAFRLSDPRIADVLLAVSRGAAKGLLTVTDRTALWPTTATNRPMDTSAPVTCVFADLNTWQLYAVVKDKLCGRVLRLAAREGRDAPVDRVRGRTLGGTAGCPRSPRSLSEP